MTEKQNTPEIRFEGFTDPWEQRKLGELCTISKGHGYSKADIRDAGTPLILYGRLYTQYESRIENVDTFAVEQEGSLLSKGDEVIVPASGETAEDIAVASSVRRSGIIFGGDLNVVTPVSKLDPDYIALAITYSKAHDDLAKRAQGKSVVHVHGNDIAEVEIPYPSESEQKRISTVVLGLANLITLHQRKYDKLCTVKKSMLDKMFPKPGETEPEIRFEGFTDPWEQRKLGELLLERNEQAPQSDQYPLMAFIANQGIAPKGDRYDRSALVNDIEGKLYKRTEKGDFIYSSNNLETGSIGLNKYGNACISPVYSIFQPSGVADSDFLGRRLVRKDFIQEMVKWRQGVIYGQWRIHEADFLRLNIAAPSVDEQRLIGKLLDNLDALITLHQRKLELLRNIKKSLLDRMFV